MITNDEKCPYPELDCEICIKEGRELPEYCFFIYN